MTRIRRVDPARLARLVQRPGIDPRTWIAVGIIEDIGYDGEEGIFADVRFLHNGLKETCAVGGAYTGNAFGMWCPLQVDDTVLVAIPGGQANNGPVVFQRLWTSADRPAVEFKGETQQNNVYDPTSNFVVKVQEGKHLKLIVDGAGQVNVEAKGSGKITIKQSGSADIEIVTESGKVYLGGTGLTDQLNGVVVGQGFDPFTGQTYYALGNASGKVLAKK